MSPKAFSVHTCPLGLKSVQVSPEKEEIFPEWREEQKLSADKKFSSLCNADECGGLLIDSRSRKVLKKLEQVDFTLAESCVSEDGSILTLVNLKVNTQRVKNNMDNHIDVCCPSVEEAEKNFPSLRKWTENAKNLIPRISCDISREAFLRDYVMARKAVILEGCLDEWPSRTWNVDSLLRSNVDWTWHSAIAVDHRPVTFDDARLSSNGELHSGRDILAFMENYNATIRVFDRIGVPPRWGREGPKHSSNKPHIFASYSIPKPMPKDLIDTTFGGSDFKWVLMGTAFTGTFVHLDPWMTDAWNSLLQGHKHWVLFPVDLPIAAFRCDMKCFSSPMEDQMYQTPWYTHVLPQLRKSPFYASRIHEAVQKPGDTIFVPSNQGHAVLNLDTTLSVTENFMSELSVMHELPVAKSLRASPLHWPTLDPTQRMWRNLMHRRLCSGESRKFARAQLEQTEMFGLRMREMEDDFI